MSIETAKKAVDFFLDSEPYCDAVAWEFIGGEPTLEMELIDELSDYIKQQMYIKNHIWFNNYMFNIGTNGTTYGSEAVQNYIQKNKNHISIGITIDGTKEKHDLQRVKTDGTGSYDDIIENVKLWIKQFPDARTKVTFASEDLIYLKDSIIHLWDLGLKNIPANVVFEDVWKESDADVFEEQLKSLADYVIENELYWDYSVRFFDYSIGFPLNRGIKDLYLCGTGKMAAVDCEGRLFPCVRFLDFCQDPNYVLCTGTVCDGYNERKDMFNELSLNAIYDDECAKCPIASGCFTCAGNNYQYTESHTIFKRTKFNCKMHKAQVRANEYFWDRLALKLGRTTPHEQLRKTTYCESGWRLDGAKYLYFVLSDSFVGHCNYTNLKHKGSGKTMDLDTFKKGIKYARDNHMIPVYLGDPDCYITDSVERYKLHVRMDYLTNSFEEDDVSLFIPIIDENNYNKVEGLYDVCILRLSEESIRVLKDIVIKLADHFNRINIVKLNYHLWDDACKKNYAKQLCGLQKMFDETINLFDDLTLANCTAGTTDITYAPDGRFYPCPAFYFNEFSDIGDPSSSMLIPDEEMYSSEKALLCNKCPVNHCQRCFYLNAVLTGMVNYPAKIQCEYSKKESNISRGDDEQTKSLFLGT